MGFPFPCISERQKCDACIGPHGFTKVEHRIFPASWHHTLFYCCMHGAHLRAYPSQAFERTPRDICCDASSRAAQAQISSAQGYPKRDLSNDGSGFNWSEGFFLARSPTTPFAAFGIDSLLFPGPRQAERFVNMSYGLDQFGAAGLAEDHFSELMMHS